mgnify:CR=1 FL=1
MGKIIKIRFACLTFCLFVFFIIETKGQYYVMDTIPQEYEIISIQKSRKARLENCNELIERVISKFVYKIQQHYYLIDLKHLPCRLHCL